MAENYTPNPVATFVNDTTAVNTVNGNFTAISTALSDCLSLSGTAPNQMKNNLDMNSNQVLNLPPPGSMNSPARLIDVVSNPSVTVPPTGTSGAVVGFLNGNNTVSGNNTYSGTSTFSGGIAGNPTFTGIPTVSPTSGSAQLTLNPQAATQQAAINFEQSGTVDWQMGKQTDNSFFIFDSVGSRNVATAVTGGGFNILGTLTNNNAPTGFVGEYISSTVGSGSAVSLSTNTPANVTSISLTAGDWDVWANAYFLFTSSTAYTQTVASISTTSATVNLNPGLFYEYSTASNTPGFSCFQTAIVGPTRLSLASTTNVFLVVQAGFTASTIGGFGIIQARRVR